MLPPLLSYLLLLSSFTLLTVRQPQILFPGNIEEVAPMAATEKRATAPVNVNYSRFKDRARADSIDVSSLPFADTALGAVEAVARPLDASSVPPLGNRATAKIDLHDIKRSVVSVSTPGALVYLRDEKETIAIARLLNGVTVDGSYTA
ncbi:hypothetical protein IWZ03DRAFT_402565 [Phyllosticta citriasiana]|uniref:Uncharacterized protein n=1 Tax=Phyllosticta citriasiana TaxID=595635 RepID=A0ABR1KYR2_9PEZI